jgi:hypothetical protein
MKRACWLQAVKLWLAAAHQAGTSSLLTSLCQYWRLCCQGRLLVLVCHPHRRSPAGRAGSLARMCQAHTLRSAASATTHMMAVRYWAQIMLRSTCTNLVRGLDFAKACNGAHSPQLVGSFAPGLVTIPLKQAVHGSRDSKGLCVACARVLAEPRAVTSGKLGRLRTLPVSVDFVVAFAAGVGVAVTGPRPNWPAGRGGTR